jgi:hypothetical protein
MLLLLNQLFLASDQAPGSRNTGDWGGVIICDVHQLTFPVGYWSSRRWFIWFCWFVWWKQSYDNSGILRYVRIEFSGIAFALIMKPMV